MFLYDIFDSMAINEYEKYKTDYYTGVNVAIFFNDVWVDEAVSISFSEDVKMLPIYKYNSYIPDEIIAGNRIVNGQIVLNYTKSNYIDTIIKSKNILNNDNYINSIIQKSDDINDITKFITTLSEEELDMVVDSLEKTLWIYAPNKTLKDQNNKSIYDDKFDIIIKFNQNNPFSNGYSSIKILNAKLYNTTFGVAANDSPLTITYGFVATTILRDNII